MVSCNWTLLTTLVLGSPGCEWHLWWAVYGPCSWWLSSALQEVSGFHDLDLDPPHTACPWPSSWWVASMVSWIWTLWPCSHHLSLALQDVSGFCGELDLDPAHNACPRFSASEWLLWWAGFGPCSCRLSLALQSVSCFCGKPDLNHANNTCPWLSSLWVASMVSWIWTLLMTPVLGSPVCELIPWWAGF